MLYPFELRALACRDIFYPQWGYAKRAHPGDRQKLGHSGGHGGRYRIRTYDFHRVKMALYR